MKRLLVLFAVLVPLSLFIAGCGGTSSAPSKKSSEPTAEQKMGSMKEKGKQPGMEKAKQPEMEK